MSSVQFLRVLALSVVSVKEFPMHANSGKKAWFSSSLLVSMITMLFRSQIMIMEPFPDINIAFSMIIQHESFNGLESVGDTPIELNLADGKKHAYSKGKTSSNSDKSCTFCGRSGHTIEICYRKNGYAPRFKFRDGSTLPKTAMASFIASTSTATKPDEAKASNSVGLTDVELEALMHLLKYHQPGATPQLHQFTTTSSSSPVEESRGIASFNALSQSVSLWIIGSSLIAGQQIILVIPYLCLAVTPKSHLSLLDCLMAL
jgi:hypothetical protein